MMTSTPWNLHWSSAFQNHTYEPLYLANGTFGGLLDLSGTTMDLWSSQCGGRNAADPESELLWPVTALRSQVYYRNTHYKEAGFWVGGTGILSDDPCYLTEPSMPHLPQTYDCEQSLDLAAGIATTRGNYYIGSHAAFKDGLSPERIIPYQSRAVFLKDSQYFALEVTSKEDTEILFAPETILEERFHLDLTGKGITRFGSDIETHITTRQSCEIRSTADGSVRYTIKPEGGEAYQVFVSALVGERTEFLERPAFSASGKLQVLVEVVAPNARRQDNHFHSFEQIVDEQKRRWSEFWQQSSIELPEAESLWQQRYHASLFYVAQSLGDGPTHPGGLSKPMLPYWRGCFHDTDTYFCRALLESGHDELAKRHLDYRHRYLEPSKQRTQAVGRSGVLFPWQSDALGGGDLHDVPINGAIIAWEAWQHHLFTGCKDRLAKAYDIVKETFINLCDHIDLSSEPLQMKAGALMTFSETMKTENPPEVRIAIRAVAAAFLDASEATNACQETLEPLARRILAELSVDLHPDGSYAIGAKVDPEYQRCPSVILGSFPLDQLVPDEALNQTFEKELARIAFLFAWLPHQASVVASQLRRSEGATSAASILRQADDFYKTWHAYDEWENRRTVRAANFVTAAGGFCLAIHHLLLSKTGANEWTLFPAIPKDWRDASFRDLHTADGWKISAKLSKGEVVSLAAHPIHSEARPITLIVPNPHDSLASAHSDDLCDTGCLRLLITPGETLILA